MHKTSRRAQKLHLHRETLRALNPAELVGAPGGSYTCLGSCYNPCATRMTMCGDVLCEPN